MTMGWLLSRGKLLADKRKLGRWGEKRCEGFLRKKGFKKLTRNFSCRGGEIDLIMVDSDGVVVFVEVKTRADEELTPAESAITATKKARMSRAASYFLATHNIKIRPFRFDVVAIVLGRKGRPQIRHYENAFVP
jgi:putative endonuclease